MRNETGFSLIELMIVVGIILIIAAIAVPNLLRSRMSANEASAVASLRTISTANLTYLSAYNIGYAGGLIALGPSTIPSSSAADILDSSLGQAAPIKNGYSFQYIPSVATPTPSSPNMSFSAAAVPVLPGSSGMSTFCVDQTNVVGKNTAGAAPGNTGTGCDFTTTPPL